MWLQHKRSDPNSTAITFQCIWCQFTAECFVQQAAGPSFGWRQSFDWWGFHHSTCGANKYRVRSIHRSHAPALFKLRIQGPNGSRMAAKASTTLAHRTVPGGKQRALPHFVHVLSCRHDPPQTDGACWLHMAHATSPGSSSAGAATLEADSTANLIDLTYPLTTFTELSAAPLDCGSPSADATCTTPPVQASFTTLSSDKMDRFVITPKHHSLETQSVQIFTDCLHHLLTSWEIDCSCGNQMGKN